MLAVLFRDIHTRLFPRKTCRTRVSDTPQSQVVTSTASQKRNSPTTPSCIMQTSMSTEKTKLILIGEDETERWCSYKFANYSTLFLFYNVLDKYLL